jgi:hypothetical protein
MPHEDRDLAVPAFNAATTGDTERAIPLAQYLLRRVTVYGATANLAATTATLEIRTAAAGGGAALVAAVLLTGLTAAGISIDLTLAAPGTVLTASSLFLRIVQGVAPVAATVKAVFEVQPLP